MLIYKRSMLLSKLYSCKNTLSSGLPHLEYYQVQYIVPELINMTPIMAGICKCKAKQIRKADCYSFFLKSELAESYGDILKMPTVHAFLLILGNVQLLCITHGTQGTFIPYRQYDVDRGEAKYNFTVSKYDSTNYINELEIQVSTRLKAKQHMSPLRHQALPLTSTGIYFSFFHIENRDYYVT